MSRSYKHTPYCGDRKNKYMKRYANKHVRQRLKNSDYLPTAAEYKKMFESYDICDYFWYGYSFESYYQKEVKYWYEWRYKYYPFPSIEECWKDYVKYYLMK